ncbi:importin-13 [Battus philenor]|uniref:importin-13 n=1 Tax=Battus philenor TaxID=42288 RepID=UPI0035D070B3
MEYTAQNLEYAVSVFYNGEQQERAKAHAWLTTAQRAPEAWNFVWELLQPHKGTEIQFYAATTLHTKILRCWNEVPAESYDELKEKILQAVTSYSKGPKIVTNRLCISLAAVILQLGAVDLVSTLRPLSNVENTSLLLEVLTVIPEEYNSMTMGTSLRSRNRNALLQACPAVLDDMHRYLQSAYNDYSKGSPSEETVLSWLSAATCAGSWLALACDDTVEYGPTNVPDYAPLCRALQTVVHVLYTWNEAVSDSALETCEAALAAVRAAGGGAGALRRPASAQQLLADLAQLAARVLARDNVPNSINEELLSAVITCLVSVSDCHSRAIVQGMESEPPQQTVQNILELLLAAQTAPGYYPLHETRSHFVFGFWYTLQDEIANMADGSRKMNPIWQEVFSRLLIALVVKSEAPADSAMSRDDLELLRCYRQDISDTVMYCYSVLGECCWDTVENAFATDAGEERQEAALHVFAALADAAPPQRTTRSLCALLRHAVRAANTARTKRLLNTALDCLGGYASWLGSIESQEGSELSRECITAAGAALQRCPAPAALALRKLCTECSAQAAALAADIVAAAQSAEGRSETFVRRQLAGAAGAALAAAPPASAAPLLHSLAHTLLADLRAQAAEPACVSGAAECSGALLGALAEAPALAADLFRTLLPALALFPCHALLLQPLYQVLKQALSTIQDQCLPIIAEVAELVVSGFETEPCASGMDVVKLLMLVSYERWSGAPRVFRACVAAGARRVAADVRASPDLTTALFALLLALTKKMPLCLTWTEDLLPQLIELACSCVRLWEAGAARAACGWLAALATHRPAALQPHAASLTAATLRCIGGATPRNQIEPLAELLLALNKAPFQETGLASWMRAALEVDGFPTPHATQAHKQTFITAVLKEKISKRRILETVQEFSLVCRGLVGTEYARQTLASKQLVA